MKTVYLDNSATTELAPRVKEKMISAMDTYGNPSSLHHIGFEAQKLLKEARARAFSALGVKNGKDENLIFTSSGTEADNLAIFGSVYAKKRRSNKIITTNSEHPAVENAMKELEADGFEVVRLSTKDGVLDLDEFKSAMDKNVLLVSIMMVNNETGALYDVKSIFKYAKSVNPDVVTHCDAIQGFMKVKFSPAELSCDLLSISGHKIHAPKGVGALYVSPETVKRKQLVPIFQGGGQENGFRSGTENIIGIAGFGEACDLLSKELSSNISKMNELHEYATGLLSELDVKLNIPKGKTAPHIINLTLPKIKSETMLHYLSGNGICISSGSACSSHSRRTSMALTAFGLSDFDADCSIRISLSEYNTKEEIDCLVNSLEQGIATLVKINRK